MRGSVKKKWNIIGVRREERRQRYWECIQQYYTEQTGCFSYGEQQCNATCNQQFIPSRFVHSARLVNNMTVTTKRRTTALYRTVAGSSMSNWMWCADQTMSTITTTLRTRAVTFAVRRVIQAERRFWGCIECAWVGEVQSSRRGGHDERRY